MNHPGTTSLTRIAQEKIVAEIAQACRVHEQYIEQHGSLGDVVRAAPDEHATG